MACGLWRVSSRCDTALAKADFISYPLLMNSNAVFLIFVSFLAGLNLGTVRKTEDPIRDTQTNPILYQQKMEEEKDGKKGALLYHVKNSPYETFFIDPPFGKAEKSPSKEITTEKAPTSADTTGWWEEQPTASQTVPPAETVSEPPSKPLSGTEQVRDLESAGQPTPSAEAEKAPSGKSDDYWW